MPRLVTWTFCNETEERKEEVPRSFSFCVFQKWKKPQKLSWCLNTEVLSHSFVLSVIFPFLFSFAWISKGHRYRFTWNPNFTDGTGFYICSFDQLHPRRRRGHRLSLIQKTPMMKAPTKLRHWGPTLEPSLGSGCFWEHLSLWCQNQTFLEAHWL